MLDETGNSPPGLVFATAKPKGQPLGVPELGGIQRQHSTSWTLTVSDCLNAGRTFGQLHG